MIPSTGGVGTIFRLHGDLQGEARLFVLQLGENPVGADPKNTIHIPARQVSRRHAVLKVNSDGVRLEDLGSTNGTYVNGVRVRKADLAENDWVQFGPVVLTFESLSVEEHELAITLSEQDKPAAVSPTDEDCTTEIGITPRSSIKWPDVLNECASRLISRWSPDVEGAMEHLAEALEAEAVALLSRSPKKSALVQAATGDLSLLDQWHETASFEALRSSPDHSSGMSSHEIATQPATSIAVAWGPESWEAALVVVANDIGPTGQPFLEVALRMFQSATIPVHEIDQPEKPPFDQDLKFPEWHVVGRTPVMRSLYRQLATLLKGSMPVLVTGETGVGKEHIVRILHASSDRAAGPLQTVNCTAIPADLLEAELFGIEAGVATGVTRRRGKLRLAHGGILFLDEIGDMDPALQAKLLRALQEGEVQPLGAASPIAVNVRVVAATNTDLEQRVHDGQFRKDLFYRIAGCEVHVPPLRRRRDDIPVLARHFLDHAVAENGNSVRGLSIGALEALQSAGWPGNVRQLQRELNRLVTACPAGRAIESSMISPSVLSDVSLDEFESDTANLDLKHHMDAVEKRIIERALEVSRGNHSESARLLGVTRNGLTMKMKRLGILAAQKD